MKKISGDKPIGITIHVYMKISQGNSCVATCISNKQKCHVFLFVFSLFSSTRLENRKAEQVLPGRRVGTSGRGEVAGKLGKRVKMVPKMCTCICKCKNDTY
jgi:hypothetical protein